MSKRRQLVVRTNKKLLFSTGIFFSFAIFLAIVTVHGPQNSSDRQLASVEDHNYEEHHHTSPDHHDGHSSSEGHNQHGLQKLHERLSVHQKIQPPIIVKIDKSSINKVYAGDVFEITAEVTSKAETKNLKVSWKIPQFMEIIAGEVDHTFEKFEAGEKRTVRMTLKSHSEDNQQIHVVASAPYGKQILSAVDQFNSTDEEDIREAKAALVQRNLNYKQQ